MAGQKENSLTMCEDFLREDIAYNEAKAIWPSYVTIAKRFLARRAELVDLYEEVVKRLGTDPRAIRAFFEAVMDSATLWSPERIALARADREELVTINSDIERLSEDLASLLDRRAALHNTSGFSTRTQYHVCELVEAAAAGNYLFNSYVKKPLTALRHQHDLKYWPSLADLMLALAMDARNVLPEPKDSLTAVGTEAKRSSDVVFLRVLLEAFRESSRFAAPLPSDFSLSHGALAAIMNCALDLEPANLRDAAYVKRARQRLRAQKIAKEI